MHKRTNMSGFQCKYCFKKWLRKEAMEKHSIMCGFWHKSTQLQEDDYDTIPTITELFKLVKEFAYKCDKLQKRVDQLETRNAIREKKHILEYLNEHSPQITTVDLVRTFDITQEHLESVFETDLTTGIKNCLKYNIQKYQSTQSIALPICGFTQKTNTLYTYEIPAHDLPNTQSLLAPTWHIMTNAELDKIINILAHKFLKSFVMWKKTNFPELSKPVYEIDDMDEDHQVSKKSAVNESIAHQHQIYAIKINGGRINEERRRSDIKNMLYAHLQKSLPSIIAIV